MLCEIQNGQQGHKKKIKNKNNAHNTSTVHARLKGPSLLLDPTWKIQIEDPVKVR